MPGELHIYDGMITFDSITLVPGYSEISSRSEVDVSTTIKGVKSNIPIINEIMHAVCSPHMIKALDKANVFSSYHRFFSNEKIRNNTLKDELVTINKDLFFPSVGVQSSDYEFVDWLIDNGFKNLIVDVNHGHHIKVKHIIEYITKKSSTITIMAGNVSTNDGIKFLADAGADIIKVGNSFGFSCTTLPSTGFGVHPLHAAKTYREETGDWDTALCIDGGVKNVSDIAKSLIYSDIVMLGKMFAGTTESNGKFITGQTKEYYGNASAMTKEMSNNHVKYIEGGVRTVPWVGNVENLLTIIEEGLQSAFSFVGASNLSEYQTRAVKNILEL